MNRTTKLLVYFVLAAVVGTFAWKFKGNYDRLMAGTAATEESDLTSVKVPEYQKKAQPLQTDYHLGFWGGGLVLSVLALGLLAAHDTSQYLGSRAVKAVSDDESTGLEHPDYEKAEDEWNKGNYLEAIQMFRDYLKANPRQQHAALRIAEIYEKDLQNPLAAALEYEEVLKQNLPPERWGWAAIHLCNLYTGKLNKFDQAIELLRRIDAEYGQTAAAEKARKRLAQLAEEGIIPPLPSSPSPTEPSEPPSTPPSPGGLPPGFTPKHG